MNTIRGFIDIKNKSSKFWFVALIFIYTIARGILIDIPFINLLTRDFETGILFFWILMLLFWKFTYQNLIIASAVLLIAYSCSMIIRNGVDNDSLGVMIYLSLLVAFIKYIKEYR